MTAKKVSAKDFLINNGIIVVLLLLAVFTAIKQPTFFSRRQLNQYRIKRSSAIHHRLRCIRMLNYKRYRPFRRTYGWSFCLLSRYLTSEAGLQRQVLPEPSGFRKCLGLMGSRGSSDLCGNLLYLWFHQWYRNFLLTGSGLHRNTWYAADRLRCLPCLHKRDSDRWLS